MIYFNDNSSRKVRGRVKNSQLNAVNMELVSVKLNRFVIFEEIDKIRAFSNFC